MKYRTQNVIKLNYLSRHSRNARWKISSWKNDDIVIEMTT